jgi:hypothetical protein
MRAKVRVSGNSDVNVLRPFGESGRKISETDPNGDIS